MKKIILLQTILFCAFTTFAQLKVIQNGNVGIGGDQPLSKLGIRTASMNNTAVEIEANKSLHGFMLTRKEDPGTGFGSWQYGLLSLCDLTAGYYSIGARSQSHSSSIKNSGRAAGFYSFGGNSTNGYNFGVIGAVAGEQNGTGILGLDISQDVCPYIDGRYAGYFRGNVKVTGTINAINISSSDARYKQNVVRLGGSETGLRSSYSGILDDVMRLSPVKYNLKQTYFEPISDTTKIRAGVFSEESQMYKKNHFGLIAQELREVYPDLVYEEDNGYLAINYTGLIPLLVQSIKELNEKIETLQASSITLDRSLRSSAVLSEQESVSDAVLYQNTPNPFTSSTRIEYFLPETVKTAYLCIYDMQGKQLKQIILTQRGKAEEIIYGSQLTAGIYLYALIADGQEVGVKRMVLTE